MASVAGARVRRARPADRSDVIATVAAAFGGDPAWGFILGPEYERVAPHFAGALFDLRVGSGDVWVTDDLAAVAMWEPPGGSPLAPEAAEAIWGAFGDVAGAAVDQRLTAYDSGVAAARPTGPFWYLGVLATRPDRQGEGLATAVLSPVLEVADRGGIPCCLETSTAANRGFYEARGFTIATDVHIADGPTTWWLRRDAQDPRDASDHRYAPDHR